MSRTLIRYWSDCTQIQMFLSGSEPGGPTFGKCPPPS